MNDQLQNAVGPSNDSLREAQESILRSRRALTDQMFSLAEQIKSLHIDDRTQADIFLEDCGLGPDDIAALRSLNEDFTAAEIALMKSRRITLETVKAILKTDEVGRTMAFFDIAAGIAVTAASIVRRREALRSLDERIMFARSVAFKKAGEAAALEAEHGFISRASDLLSKMKEFESAATNLLTAKDRKPAETLYDNAWSWTASLALHLKPEFDRAFGIDFPHIRDWGRVEDPAHLYLAQARHALIMMANGDFGPELPGDEGTTFKWDSLSALAYLAGETPKNKYETSFTPLSDIEPLSAVDIRAQAGSTTLGVETAGFDIRAVFAEPSFEAGLKVSSNNWDIHQLSLEHGKEVVRSTLSTWLATASSGNEIDLVTGCTQAGPWNNVGHGLVDPRDLLLRSLLAVEVIRPRAFFFELDVGYKGLRHTVDRRKIDDYISRLGYSTATWTLSTADFGLPLDRCRKYLVGIKTELFSKLSAPIPSKPKTLVHRVFKEAFPHFVGLRRIKGARDDRSEKQRLYDYWCSAWVKLHKNDAPGPDLSVVRFGGRRPNQHRQWEKRGFGRLSSKEMKVGDPRLAKWADTKFDESKVPPIPTTIAVLKALQGLPKDWHFDGTVACQAEAICDAAPPIMSHVISRSIHQAITGQRVNPDDISVSNIVNGTFLKMAKETAPGDRWRDEVDLYYIAEEPPEISLISDDYHDYEDGYEVDEPAYEPDLGGTAFKFPQR